MAHIVGVWELGGHLGHIGRFAGLVPEFIERGHRVTLVLRDLARIQSMASLEHAAVMQAPVWMPKSRSAPTHPVSMPEILQHLGYLSVPGLQGMVRAWRDTFDALQPDLLLCDLAPTALLASRDMPCVRTSIGSGYGIPPSDVTPMPVFRAVSSEVRKRSLEAEQKVTRVIQAVARNMGQPSIDRVSDIFKVDEAFLCTLPELDHYDRPQPAHYWGLPTQASGGQPPQWSDSGRLRVFAYVKPPGAHVEATIKAIQQSGCEAEIFAPGIARASIEKHASTTLRISTHPYDLAKTFSTCDVVICHAGHETVVEALLAGRPVVLIPQQMEQFAFAGRVKAQGLGEIVTPDALSYLPQALERVLDTSSIERARAFSEKHAIESPTAAAEKVVDRCESLLKR